MQVFSLFSLPSRRNKELLLNMLAKELESFQEKEIELLISFDPNFGENFFDMEDLTIELEEFDFKTLAQNIKDIFIDLNQHAEINLLLEEEKTIKITTNVSLARAVLIPVIERIFQFLHLLETQEMLFSLTDVSFTINEVSQEVSNHRSRFHNHTFKNLKKHLSRIKEAVTF